jgi:hypothetical protein
MTKLWREIEIELMAEHDLENPYLDVEVWADFTHSSGVVLRRPAFWDGGRNWKIRFAPTIGGHWTWQTFASLEDVGLIGKSGELTCESDPSTEHHFYKHGFWHMSPGGRSLVHADATPVVLVGDTAWAFPWRATLEQAETYAKNRQEKGFNAVLLMSVQPDMRAVGPRDRTLDEGFDVGFEDLPTGHINQLRPEYFQFLDQLVAVLVAHEIVPVWQPVFMGFGWKGLDVAGPVLPPSEYARYCRYLVARYGARPAVYLVGGDGSGYEAQVAPGGEEVQTWDAYAQPTGIHYRPHADNKAHQDATWLDFQWCQTGHSGVHVPERVADMLHNLPIKAIANGEPSYENTAKTGHARGWWQGHEAWSNLCAGGTMGVVYGAGSLWQWVLRDGEKGQDAFFSAPGSSWREAIDFEGSSYVGLVSKILHGLPFTDMAPNWNASWTPRGLSVPDKLFIAYNELGGPLMLLLAETERVPHRYRIVDPRTGVVLGQGERSVGEERHVISTDHAGPLLFIFSSTF